MPIGMISKLARWLADALRKRGYQSSGVAILRPAISVTTRSLAVNATARGRRSPTAISKVLIPSCRYVVAIRFQMADNITKFGRGKSGVNRAGQYMHPELTFPAPAA